MRMRGRSGGWVSVGVGIVCLIIGLAWGVVGTHTVSYVNSQDNLKYEISVGTQSGNVYINAASSKEYFVALKEDFSPAISEDDIQKSSYWTFVARTDTTEISLKLDDGTTINEAHKIEKLVFYNKDNSVLSTYTTSEYAANPSGASANAWSQSVWVALLGVLLIVAGIFQTRRKQNTGFSIGTPAQQMPPSYPGAQQMPPSYPGMPPQGSYPPPQQNPYQQPPQGSYPPPQQNPYQQPPQGSYPPPQQNPYQQPPQG